MKKREKREFNVPVGVGRAMFVSVNVLVWVIILFFPFLMATRDGDLVSIDNYMIYSWIPLMFMLVFYLNYYFLVDKLIFEMRNWVLFLLCNLVVIVVVSSSTHILQDFYQTQLFPKIAAAESHEDVNLATRIIRDGLVLMLVIGLSVALKMVMAWQENQNERARLESEKRNAELQNLRSQLNPHFLFNTLNNIYGLTLSDGEKAREAIHALSSILRYILYTPDERVPLEKEVDFIRSYVDLMRLRTGGGMSVEMTLPADTQGVVIAPLMFMTLVENAFKHGVSQDGQPSFVRIAIEVEEGAESGSKGAAQNVAAAQKTEAKTAPAKSVVAPKNSPKSPTKKVVCLVENSNFPKADTDRSGSGIGIENLSKRLALLYPKAHELAFEHRDGTHVARLTIKP